MKNRKISHIKLISIGRRLHKNIFYGSKFYKAYQIIRDSLPLNRWIISNVVFYFQTKAVLYFLVVQVYKVQLQEHMHIYFDEAGVSKKFICETRYLLFTVWQANYVGDEVYVHRAFII